MGSLKFYRWFYLCMELCLQTKTKEDQKKSYYFKKKQVDAGKVKFLDLEAYFNIQISCQLRTRVEKAGIPENPEIPNAAAAAQVGSSGRSLPLPRPIGSEGRGPVTAQEWVCLE